jgi:hypothetical protein
MGTNPGITRTAAKRGGTPIFVLIFVITVCSLAVALLLKTRPRAILDHSGREISRPVQAASRGAQEARETFATSTLDATDFGATAVVEQPSSTRYNIKVKWAAGDQQSIAVTAPPGGLYLEARDMTGDDVPNDLVLRPALHWPLIVLLNDGHNHFTVAISGTPSNAFDSGNRASSGRQFLETLALTSTGSPGGRLANHKRLVASQLQQDFLALCTQSVFHGMCHTSLSGRSPPTTFNNS